MSAPQIQGENCVQSPIISSSAESYTIPFASEFAIRGRQTYRSPFLRNPLQSPELPSQSGLVNDRVKCAGQMNGSSTKFKAPGPEKNGKISTRYATLAVLVIFVSSLSGLYIVYKTFPQVTEEERQHFKVPWNIEDAKNLGIVLSRYKGDHYYHVMGGVFLSYIFLQTFAIPGSLFLSILSGYLFPFYVALILVCTCSMVGASLCFMLSQLLGRRLVLKHFPERASDWKKQVDKHKDNLLNYMVFLRVTPLLPNWFINLTAPVIGVPLFPFAVGTFVGVAPPSFFAIQGGQTLHSMTVENTSFNTSTFLWLLGFGIISIIPIFLKNRI